MACIVLPVLTWLGWTNTGATHRAHERDVGPMLLLLISDHSGPSYGTGDIDRIRSHCKNVTNNSLFKLSFCFHQCCSNAKHMN